MKKSMPIVGIVLLVSAALSADKSVDLFNAVANGEIARTKELVDSGVSIKQGDPRNNLNITPFMQAARIGHYDIAVYLLEKGVDINSAAADGRNALMLAVGKDACYEGPFDQAQKELMAMVKFLIDRGITIDHRDTQGMTALMYAVNAGWLGVVEQLLEAGASPWIQAKDGKTALALSKLRNAGKVDAILAKRMHLKVR